MIVKHRVADFGKWKEVFDSMIPVRKSFGWTGHEVLRDSSDPNLVTIINKMQTIEQAHAYGSSPDLKDGMQRAGVISAPEISFCDDVDVTSY
jgi:hypothetical protein